MNRRKIWIAGVAAVAALTAITVTPAISSSANHPTTGVGSCTLKGYNAAVDPNDAHAPIGHRLQTYKPDNYNCTGAIFAKPGVEFRKFPQPHDLSSAT